MTIPLQEYLNTGCIDGNLQKNLGREQLGTHTICSGWALYFWLGLRMFVIPLMFLVPGVLRLVGYNERKNSSEALPDHYNSQALTVAIGLIIVNAMLYNEMKPRSQPNSPIKKLVEVSAQTEPKQSHLRGLAHFETKLFADLLKAMGGATSQMGAELVSLSVNQRSEVAFINFRTNSKQAIDVAAYQSALETIPEFNQLEQRGEAMLPGSDYRHMAFSARMPIPSADRQTARYQLGASPEFVAKDLEEFLESLSLEESYDFLLVTPAQERNLHCIADPDGTLDIITRVAINSASLSSLKQVLSQIGSWEKVAAIDEVRFVKAYQYQLRLLVTSHVELR